MENSNKHILLISYVFPPYPGIGGRRWAKFAKYLAKNGYTVHVICSKNPFKETSLFVDDVIDNPNIKIYPLDLKYPFILIRNIKSIADKFLYKVALLYVKIFSKGNYYDRGVFAENSIVHKSFFLIDNFDIKNVIVTGAPFSLYKYGIKLREKYKKINLIADMRDPWTWGTGYGMQGLSVKRKKVEEMEEQSMINNYDTVTVPVKEMEFFLKIKYPSESGKIKLIDHGYDTTELLKQKKAKSSKVRLLYYGTFYHDTQKKMEILLPLIAQNENRFKFDVYSNDVELFDKMDFKNQNWLSLNRAIPPQKLFKQFVNYDFVVIIQPDFAKDFITTKIYEIIYSETPIILISLEGNLSRFVLENNIGIHILPTEVNEQSIKMIFEKKYNFEKIDIKKFDYESLTNSLISNFK